MRRRHPPRSLGSILDGVIDQLGIRSKLRESEVVDAWFEISGPAVSAITESIWVSSGRLFVKVSSPTWRHELNLQRDEWRDRLNDHVGSRVIREIVFR